MGNPFNFHLTLQIREVLCWEIPGWPVPRSVADSGQERALLHGEWRVQQRGRHTHQTWLHHHNQCLQNWGVRDERMGFCSFLLQIQYSKFILSVNIHTHIDLLFQFFPPIYISDLCIYLFIFPLTFSPPPVIPLRRSRRWRRRCWQSWAWSLTRTTWQ